MDSLSKWEDSQYTSIEEIKRLKVQELKTIMSNHGQPVTGKKADVVHGFLVSFPSVSRLFLDPLLSKSNTTFAISPLFTKNYEKNSQLYRISLGLVQELSLLCYPTSDCPGNSNLRRVCVRVRTPRQNVLRTRGLTLPA